MTWVAVAVGGALGSLARHWVNLEVAHRLARATPWSTVIVNIVGCAVIGVLAGLTASGRLHLEPATRTFVFVGILGGFTTFSTFGLDTFTLGHGGDYSGAFLNVVAQVGLGLAVVWLGFRLAVA